MFTGLIEEIGQVKFRSKKSNSLILGIQAEKIASETKIGDSISINGACLTVSNIKNKILFFTAVAETLKVSTLNDLRIGNRTNLERALKVDARFDGHFINGHIDGKGKVTGITSRGNSKEVRISVPYSFTQLIVAKGSIAVDGVSLTVVDVGRNCFTVALIPHTLKNSILGMRRQGDKVNIELDIIAKYIAKIATIKR